MYNEKQKKRYLKYCKNYYEPQTVKLIGRVFNSTEVSESQFNKDISTFNPVEVVDFLKGLNSSSRRRLQTTCIMLSKYFEWCYNVEHLITNIVNPFDSRTMELVIDGVLPKEDLNNKYFTKEQFMAMLNDVMDVSNKFIAYAFYNGLTLEELVHIKMKDLDFNSNMLMLVSGRKIVIDDLFKNLMVQTSEETQYFADGIEKYTRTNSYNYAESEYIVRSCNKNMIGVVTRHYITSRMRVINEQMDGKLISITTLTKNGLINHIKEQYAKQNISLKEALLDKINGKLYVHDIETQKYIEEFGQKMTIRFLRMEIKDYIELL